MDEEIKKKYLEAGRILGKVREESKSIVKEGMLLLELANKLEDMIRENGAEVAFPACLSINDIAAHQSPGVLDETKIPERAVIKIDLGCHTDGYVADSAYTVDFSGENKNLVEASKAALDAAVEQMYTGNKIARVSEAIEKTIKDFSLKPVSNLTGHRLEHYFLHAAPPIPNINTGIGKQLEEGQVFAVEPFASNGAGRVKDAGTATIFRLAEMRPVRNPESRRIIEFAQAINMLPFSERWIPVESRFKLRLALRELQNSGVIDEYPALKDAEGGLVSQAEHTVIVADKPIVTTL